MLFLYIFGSIAFAVVTIFAWAKIHRYRKGVAAARAAEKKSLRIGREADELLARAEQGDTQAQNELVDCRYSSSNPVRRERLEANKKVVEIRRNWWEHGERTRRAYAAWQESSGTKKEPMLLAKFVSAYNGVVHQETLERLVDELGLKPEEAKSRLVKVLRERYERLVSEMLESRDSFLELRELIAETRLQYGAFEGTATKSLPYPDRWNDAVVRHFKNPHVKDFARSEDPAPGQLRLWATEALRGDDIVTMKLVLAYANLDPHYRAELGDVLTAELGKRVTRHHASLVAGTSTPIEPSA